MWIGLKFSLEWLINMIIEIDVKPLLKSTGYDYGSRITK